MQVGVAVVALGVVVVVWIALTRSSWRPPEVAPLAPEASFSADLVVTHADAYVAAGVVGTREPDAEGRCSGRFALVELDASGIARSAVVTSGLERDRWCANEVEALVSDGHGAWLVAGVGRSEPEPSFDVPGTRGERLTLRISAAGEPREEFGDHGILHRTVVVGRLHGELITDELERVTEEGEVRADVLLDADSTASTWTSLFALDDEIVVAVRDFGRDLEFQSFVVEGTPPPLRFRPLRSLPPGGADPAPGLSVDLGESRSPFSFSQAAIHEDRLYVLRQPYEPSLAVEPRLLAVDPRGWALVRSFGGDGVVPVPGLAGAPAAFAVDRHGNVLVAGAAEVGSLAGGLLVRRLTGDGSVDADFGGAVHRRNTGAPGAAEVVVDGNARTVVLGADRSSLVRLTPGGRLDPSFGTGGLVDLGGLDVCALEPGRSARACTER